MNCITKQILVSNIEMLSHLQKEKGEKVKLKFCCFTNIKTIISPCGNVFPSAAQSLAVPSAWRFCFNYTGCSMVCEQHSGILMNVGSIISVAGRAICPAGLWRSSAASTLKFHPNRCGCHFSLFSIKGCETDLSSRQKQRK